MAVRGSDESWFTQRRRRLMATVLATAGLASLPRGGRAVPIVAADMILRNVRILTVDSAFTTAQAVAVAGKSHPGDVCDHSIVNAFVQERKVK